MLRRKRDERTPPSGPNLIWVGEGKPPEQFQAGMNALEVLPDEATQRAGFIARNASLLFQIHRPNYKRFVAGRAVDEPDATGAPAKTEETEE